MLAAMKPGSQKQADAAVRMSYYCVVLVVYNK